MKTEEKAYKRFLKLRRRVMEAIEKTLKIDPYCKSYEGAMELTLRYPNFFEQCEEDVPCYCEIRLHCYVLGPARHYIWTGETLDEAVDKAKQDLDVWLGDVE